MAKKVLILAGGGGHTSIALALAQALQGKTEISFLIPKGDTLSRDILGPYGRVDELIKGRFPRTSNLLFPFRFMAAFYHSFSMVNREYSVVVSTGSNFCVPPAIAAWLKSIPVINIESRVAILKPSRTALFLQRFSDNTLLQWVEQKERLRGEVVGPIFPKKRYEDKDLGYILVTGGTEGHKRLFDTIDEINLPRVIMQTGKVDPDPYRVKHPAWEVFSYSNEFEKLIAESHLVITHQGGGTIFEALMYNKPLIIVFNPELPRTATIEDTETLAERVGAKFMGEVEPWKLRELIENVCHKEFLFGEGRDKAAAIILENMRQTGIAGDNI